MVHKVFDIYVQRLLLNCAMSLCLSPECQRSRSFALSEGSRESRATGVKDKRKLQLQYVYDSNTGREKRPGDFILN